jgi:predicted amidophosphoribosyltransferase
MWIKKLLTRGAAGNPVIAPLQLGGEFDWGYSLDAYATGGKRTSMGGLIYRLKYRYDLEVADTIVGIILKFLDSQDLLRKIELLTVVPPSFISRPFYSVAEVARRLAAALNLKYDPQVFMRTSLSVPQKKIKDRAMKIKNLESVFTISARTSPGGEGVLLLDDLFDSGATATYLTRLLREAGASYVAVLTFGHTSWAPEIP